MLYDTWRVGLICSCNNLKVETMRHPLNRSKDSQSIASKMHDGIHHCARLQALHLFQCNFMVTVRIANTLVLTT